MRQFPTTPIDHDVIATARTAKSEARSQDGACRLEPQKEAHAVAWNTMQTRGTEMLACGCTRTRAHKCHGSFPRNRSMEKGGPKQTLTFSMLGLLMKNALR